MGADAQEAGTSYPADLVETFEEIARLLLVCPTLDQALARIVLAAVAVIPGCKNAGISLVKRREIATPSASDEIPVQVDAIQHETGQGPGLDAIREQQVFQVDDLAQESRWPDFATRAAEESGVRSMLSFRLFVREHTMGALTFYSQESAAFGEEARMLGAVFAAHAAVAMSASSELESLNAALLSRATIEQAKGIIMGTTGCGADEAFDLLRQQSQVLNEKLRDIAADLVERSTRR